MSGVEFLEKLLAGAGVDWKPLSEVAEFKRGEQLRPDDLVPGPYPVVTAGKTQTGSHSEWNFGPFSITVTSHGAYAGHVNYWTTPIWLASNVFLVLPVSSILPKYLFYFLKNSELKIQGLAKGGGVPYFNTRDVAPLLIPIPSPNNPKKSLEIQAEIVLILDAFTELTTELTTELNTRKKQYHFYRDQLLTFENEEVEWKTLREVAEVRSGWGFPNAEQGRDEGLYPFYKVSDMNIVGNGTTMTTANNYIDSETEKRLGIKVAPPGTVIFPKIGAAVATNKKRLLSVAAAYDNNVMGLIPGNLINSRFLFFWMQTVNLSTLANDSGAVPSIRKSEMEEMLVPVPRPEEQARIVAILDKFDALTNSITEGLPREIELRQKQYECYRDLLLSFPKLEGEKA